MWLLIDQGLYYLYVTQHYFLWQLLMLVLKCVEGAAVLSQYSHIPQCVHYFSQKTTYCCLIYFLKRYSLPDTSWSDFIILPLRAHECRRQCEFTSSAELCAHIFTVQEASGATLNGRHEGGTWLLFFFCCFIVGLFDLRCLLPPLAAAQQGGRSWKGCYDNTKRKDFIIWSWCPSVCLLCKLSSTNRIIGVGKSLVQALEAWAFCFKYSEKGFVLCVCSDLIGSWHYYFWMHAVLTTANIVQYCPDGCRSHTCALEGNHSQHFISHGRWIRQVRGCSNFSCLYKKELFLKFHLPGGITPVWRLENLHVNLYSTSKNLHFIWRWKLHFDTSVPFFVF